MSVNAGKGSADHTLTTKVMSKRITFSQQGQVVSLGWLPANSGVISSGVHVRTVFNSAGTDTVLIGFRNSVQGATADNDAFTESALSLEALGHVAGDVVSAANIFFSAPAEVTCTPATTSGTSTTGEAYVYIEYVAYGNQEDL